MSNVLAWVQELVARNEVRPPLHGFRELAADGILLDDLLGGIEAAVVIEDMWFGAFAKAARVPLFW